MGLDADAGGWTYDGQSSPPAAARRACVAASRPCTWRDAAARRAPASGWPPSAWQLAPGAASESKKREARAMVFVRTDERIMGSKRI